MNLKNLIFFIPILMFTLSSDLMAEKAVRKRPAKKAVVQKKNNKPANKKTPMKENSKKNYTEIKDKEHYDEIKNYPGLQIIKFYANWCGACNQFAETFDKVAKENLDKAGFFAINIDKEELKPLLTEHKVQAVPTVVFIKDGKQVAIERGAMGEQELTDKIKTHSK